MKRFLAILLAAMLLTFSCGAWAQGAVKLNENSDALDFTLTVENGSVTEQAVYEPGVIGSVELTGMENLLVFFSLMPDDSYTDMDMSELTADDVNILTGNVINDLGESVSELYDMPCGLKALTIQDVANTEYIAMTLIDGYFFYMSGFHTDFSPLNDAEKQAVKQVFDSLQAEKKAV